MSTREDREAAMIAYNGPDSVNRPRHREWIERGGDDCGATVYEVAQAIANARADGYARGQRAADEHAAAAVERERERVMHSFVAHAERLHGKREDAAAFVVKRAVATVYAPSAPAPRAPGRRRRTTRASAARARDAASSRHGSACSGASTATAPGEPPRRAPGRGVVGKRTARDAWWHCTFCGDHALADEPYEVGDKDPCITCGEGTALVMTTKQAAKYESEIARGVRVPTRSYAEDTPPRAGEGG